LLTSLIVAEGKRIKSVQQIKFMGSIYPLFYHGAVQL